MTSYPQNLDTDGDLPAVVDNVTEIGGEAINALREAVFALERALGTNPQGAATNLTTRLSESLNDDGTFKAAALIAAGLVSLPIVNSQVGASAGIVESKLELDVGTQNLQNQVSSNDLDILSLQNSIASLLNNFTRHVNGQAFKHDGFDVTISGLTGQPSLATVEDALNYLRDSFLDHVAATAVGEHFASAITYEPDPLGVIQADNVQDAITGVEADFVEDRRKHNDSAHSNGVSNDGYVFLGGQGATNAAAAKLTRYQSFSASDIIQIGLVNAASIKSDGFSAEEISSSAHSIQVTAEIGTGISRSVTINNIHLNAEHPTGSGRINLRGVVDYLNAQFATSTNYFPVSAYESSDGELVLQHNIARNDCTVTVANPGSNSAVSALGFASVDGLTSSRVQNNYLHVNGNPYTELQTISLGEGLTQSLSDPIVDLGIDVTASGLDLYANSLIHIYNHSVSSANGTYRIATIAPSSSTDVGLFTALAAGTFDYIIYADSFDTNYSGNFRCVDFYLDADLNAIASERMQVTTVQVSGLRVIGVSQDFPAATGASFSVDKLGTTYSVWITIGADSGEITNFEEGYLGLIRVYAPDNKAHVEVLVFDNLPPPGSGGPALVDTVDFYASEAQDDRLLLGTTFSNAGAVLEIPEDNRNVGLTGLTAIASEFTGGVLERDLSNLQSGGIIRGFDVLSTTTSAIELNGGAAYVGGRFIEKTRQDVTITNLAISDGSWNVLLLKNGNLAIFEEGTEGFSVADIITDDDKALLTQVTVSGGNVTSTTDGRRFVNDLQAKLLLSVDDNAPSTGGFRTLEAAILYSDAYPNSAKQEIVVNSDFTTSASIILSGTKELRFLGTLTCAGLSLSGGARMICMGAVSGSSTLTIDTSSYAEFSSTLTLSGAVTLGANSRLVCRGDVSIASLTISGDNAVFNPLQAVTTASASVTGQSVSIIGGGPDNGFLFDGTAAGLTVDGYACQVSDIDLIMDNANQAVVLLEDNASGFLLRDSFVGQRGVRNEALWTSSRQGIRQATTDQNLQDVRVIGSTFYNLGYSISGDDLGASSYSSYTHLTVERCSFTYSGAGVVLENATNVSITNCSFERLRDYGVYLVSNVNHSGDFLRISNNYFGTESSTSTTLKCISVHYNSDNVFITQNQFDAISGTNIVELSTGGSNPSGVSIQGNNVDGCTTSGYAIDLSQSINANTSSNTIVNHTGDMVLLNGGVFANNTVSGTSTSGVLAPFTGSASSASNCSNNVFVITTNNTKGFSIPTGSFVGNRVETNNVILLGDARISDNYFDLSSTSISAGISVNSSGVYILNGNYIESDATNSTVNLNQTGSFTFSDNYINNLNGNNALILGNGSTLTSNSYHAVNNTVLCAGGTSSGIQLNAVNCSVVGNFILGSVSVGDIDIVAQSGGFIDGNVLGTTAGAGTKLIDPPGTNNGIFIGRNKYHTQRFAFSVLNAGTSAVRVTGGAVSTGSGGSIEEFDIGAATTFAITTESNGANDYLLVPIPGLPDGATITAAGAVLSVSTTASVGIGLSKRTTTSTNASTVFGISNNTVTGLHELEVTGSEVIVSGDEYFIVVRHTLASVPVTWGYTYVEIQY